MNVSLRFERFKGHSTLGRPMPESLEQKLPLPSASEREVLRVIAANSFDHSTDRDDSGMALQPKLGFLSERCPRNHSFGFVGAAPVRTSYALEAARVANLLLRSAMATIPPHKKAKVDGSGVFSCGVNPVGISVFVIKFSGL